MPSFEIKTKSDLDDLRRRCFAVAKKNGFPEEADDFLGNLILWNIEGKRQGASLDQCFIDHLRKTHGDSRSFGGARSALNHIPIDELGQCSFGEKTFTPESLKNNQQDELGRDSGQYRISWLYHIKFGAREQEIAVMILDGKSQVEISRSFNISEVCVSQAKKRILAKIERFEIGLHMRDLIKEIEPFETDWIVLS